MKLIVGLGNPGDKFANTRHNMGFMVLDNFAKSLGVSIDKNKFNGLYTEVFIDNEKAILLKPLSYMNLSGGVVFSFINYFNIDISDVLIISDDLDLDFLKVKLKYRGSSGGHNGLRDIEKYLNTQEYKRFKIGISNNKSIETKDYVLSKFSYDDLDKISVFLEKSNMILSDFIKLPFEVLMSKYN